MNKSEVADAARILRAVLQQTEDGTLSDGGPPARGLMQRLRGATAALEVVVAAEGKRA